MRAGHQGVCSAIHHVVLGNESVENTDLGLLPGEKVFLISHFFGKEMSHTGVLPWEVKGGIKNFRLLYPKVCLYRRWSQSEN